jgi:polyhydroxyalkanoate synthesis regulator phasin
MRTIKTYANGRFYDMFNKRYMSKDQLMALINKKDAIKIVMHPTGRDVTQSVLKKMGAGASPKKASMLNIDTLRKWVSEQVDGRIEKAVDLINLPTKGQINRLTDDIKTLTKKVDELQLRLSHVQSPDAPPTHEEPAEAVGVQA